MLSARDCRCAALELAHWTGWPLSEILQMETRELREWIALLPAPNP